MAASAHVIRPGSRPEPVPPEMAAELSDLLEPLFRSEEWKALEGVLGYVALFGFDRVSHWAAQVHSSLAKVPDIDRGKLSRPVFEAVYVRSEDPVTMVEVLGQCHDYSLYFRGTPENLLARLAVLEVMQT